MQITILLWGALLRGRKIKRIYQEDGERVIMKVTGE